MITHDFSDLTKRKPQSVSPDLARWAIVGTYGRSSGVLCLCSNRTNAGAGETGYRKHGSEDVRVVSTEDLRRDDIR